MRLYIKSAIFSAIVTLALSAILLGVRLTQVGTELTLVGAEPAVLWQVAAATALIFFYNLLRDYIDRFFGFIPKPSLPSALHSLGQRKSLQRLLWSFLIVAALMFPFLGSRSQVDLATLVLIYIMLSLGLNIVVGLAGLLDLGYVGFYAVGAYTYAMLAMYFGIGFWTGLVAAGIMAAFFGFILGFPVLRLRGDYLAIVTLGFGEIIRIMLNNLTHLTGGPRGIGSIPKPTLFNLEFSRRATEGTQTFHEFFGIDFNSMHRVIFLYLLEIGRASCRERV